MIVPQNNQIRKRAFAGGNIEWNQIPKSGDVYDFGSFYAYHTDGKWYVAYWDSLNAVHAQKALGKLVRATERRLAKTNH